MQVRILKGMWARILKKNKVVIKLIISKFNYTDVTKIMNLGEEI